MNKPTAILVCLILAATILVPYIMLCLMTTITVMSAIGISGAWIVNRLHEFRSTPVRGRVH